MTNVKDFGARGDGWTDDSAALTAALAQGGEVFVPPGIYLVGQSVELTQSGTRFYGVPRQSILRLTPESRESVLVVPKRWTETISPADVVQDIEIADLVLDGNMNPNHDYEGGAADYFGLFLRQVDGVRLSGLLVRNLQSDGITISSGTQSKRFLMEDCVIHTCGRNGLHLGSVVGAVVRRCHIYDTPSQHWGGAAAAAIDIEVEGLLPCGVWDVLIEDCTFERYDTKGAGAGVNVAPAYGPLGDMTIRRCLIRNHQVGVLVIGTETPAGSYDHTVRDITIEDCTILDDAIAVTGYGVQVQYGADVTICRNLHRSHMAYASLAVTQSQSVEIADNRSISCNWFLLANGQADVLLGGNFWRGWYAFTNIEDGSAVTLWHNDEQSGVQVQNVDVYAEVNHA